MDMQFNDLYKPDQNVEYYCSPWQKSRGFTPLMKYVLMVRKYPEVISLVSQIIKDVNKVNCQNDEGYTALMIACANYDNYSNNLVIKMLIDAGADVNIQNNYLTTAAMIACRNRNIEVVKMLIAAGADVNIKHTDGQTILMNISTCLSTDIIKILIDAKADVNVVDNNSVTALILAVKFSAYDNNMEIVQILINAGANVNYVTSTGQNALMIAGRYSNNIEIVKLLIDAGTNVNTKNVLNQTSLMILLMTGNLNNYSDIVIQLLYLSRETLLDKDVNCKTAYDYYVKSGYDILDEYHLKILKGEIRLNMTKSARF